jgi:hypothetical protein
LEEIKAQKISNIIVWGELAGYNQHQVLADVLKAMGFIPSTAKSDIWMKESNNLYEHIAVYFNDLLIAARNLK